MNHHDVHIFRNREVVGRGAPEGVARLVVFFASDEADCVHGDVVFADGGRSISAKWPIVERVTLMRVDVEFKSLDGTSLAAFLYTPDSGSGPFPAIVLSHGFGAVKEMALDRYADVFCAAGLACLLYDHRNTGSSGGTIPGEGDQRPPEHDPGADDRRLCSFPTRGE